METAWDGVTAATDGKAAANVGDVGGVEKDEAKAGEGGDCGGGCGGGCTGGNRAAALFLSLVKICALVVRLLSPGPAPAV